MNLKDKLTENWRTGAIGAAVAILIGWLSLLYFWKTGHFFTHNSYDLPLQLRTGVEDTNVVVLLMDEDAHKDLHQREGQEWNRAIHAHLIKTLSTQHVRAIAFDVVFTGAWTNSPAASHQSQNAPAMSLLMNKFGLSRDQATGAGVDHLLGAALQASNVVVGARIKRELDHRGNTNTTRTLSDPGLGNPLWGLTEFPKDSDGRIRQHNRDPEFPGFAWRVAEVSGYVPTNSPSERMQKRWIKYYGPSRTVLSLPYHKVFAEGELPPYYFSNKVVFVGKEKPLTPQGTDHDDQHETPFKEMAGVEIQATAFLNLKHQDSLTELSPVTEILLFALIGGLFGYGLTLLRPWVAAGVWVAAALAVGGANVFLVWQKYLWFPWLSVAVLQIPAALIWAIFSGTRKVYHEKEVLEETLSKVKSQVFSSPHEAATQMAIALPGGRMVQVGSAPGTDGEGKTLVVHAAGPQIPDHQLVRCIGKGAYGEVWLARDIIGSYHAVKIVFRKSFSNDSPFEREFKGIQKFTPISRQHPGFVHILHVGRNEPEGYFYYIMEVGDDETAGQKIDPTTYAAKNLAREIQRRGKLPMDECLHLSLELTSALDFLHQQNLIHRDIKPSNIIFVNDVPKIADIGLVTNVAEKGKDVTYIGTDGYIPPEGPGSPAADVFSLGKVLYETSMGRNLGHFPELPSTLFERADHRELLGFNEIILKACEVNVSIRYKTAGDMRTDLLRLQHRAAANRKPQGTPR